MLASPLVVFLMKGCLKEPEPHFRTGWFYIEHVGSP